ncbi:MAG: hypothetical protein KAR40_11055 [Candidatus Sabulitectum sp.]|nr:hypothetical protein [Candidatus Sabulitectum sp.]
MEDGYYWVADKTGTHDVYIVEARNYANEQTEFYTTGNEVPFTWEELDSELICPVKPPSEDANQPTEDTLP